MTAQDFGNEGKHTPSSDEGTDTPKKESFLPLETPSSPPDAKSQKETLRTVNLKALKRYVADENAGAVRDLLFDFPSFTKEELAPLIAQARAKLQEIQQTMADEATKNQQSPKFDELEDRLQRLDDIILMLERRLP